MKVQIVSAALVLALACAPAFAGKKGSGSERTPASGCWCNCNTEGKTEEDDAPVCKGQVKNKAACENKCGELGVFECSKEKGSCE